MTANCSQRQRPQATEVGSAGRRLKPSDKSRPAALQRLLFHVWRTWSFIGGIMAKVCEMGLAM